jgi:hypothetical protein
VFAIVTARYARKAFDKQSKEFGVLLEQNERGKDEHRKTQASRVFLAADPDDTADREYLGMIMPSGTRNAAREFSSDLEALDCTSVTFRAAAGVWWTRMPRRRAQGQELPRRAQWR